MTTEEEPDGQAWRNDKEEADVAGALPPSGGATPNNDVVATELASLIDLLSVDEQQALYTAAEAAGAYSVSESAVGKEKAARHVGIWSYPSMNAVPEISFAVQWLARRVTKWNAECERRLRRLVAYMKGHVDGCLL